MKVKVNYNEVDDLIKYIDSKKDKIESYYQNIKNDLKDIDSCWRGKDSDTFKDVSNEYIDNAIESLSDVTSFKDNLNSIIKLYKDSEENLSKKIKES